MRYRLTAQMFITATLKYRVFIIELQRLSSFQCQSNFQVLLGLPFTSSVDIFSLGLILAELLLTKPDPPAPTTRHRQPSFPTSPPQSHSPQPIHNSPPPLNIYTKPSIFHRTNDPTLRSVTVIISSRKILE